MENKLKTIKLSLLEENDGQIDGVPANPRFILPEEFEALKKSIEDNPEMLSLREIICVPADEKFIVICGNMRLRALRELGYNETICKVVENATPKQLRAYLIKDNVEFGKNDFEKFQDWDEDELKDFGVKFVGYEEDLNDEDFFTENKGEVSKNKQIVISLKNEEIFDDLLNQIKEVCGKFEGVEIK